MAARWMLVEVEGSRGWLDNLVASKKKEFMDDLLDTVPLYEQDESREYEESLLRVIEMVKGSLAASAAVHEDGTRWLEEVVAYKKKEYIDDLVTTVPFYGQKPVEIKASLVPMPTGYKDADWDEESVMRLVGMIRRSSSVSPALRHLVNNLTLSTRRAFEPRQAPLIGKFQSKSWAYDNYLYYDAPEYDDDMKPQESPADTDLVLVTNPVESQLPYTMISVEKLKDILWARALANRQMPTTEK